MKMIGLAEKFEGLYHLILKVKNEDGPSINNTSICNLPKKSLWYFRLGHLSSARMQCLHNRFPFIVIDQGVACDVFYYVKHKNLPYYSSFNKSKQPFDIVHFYVWDPLVIQSYHGHSYFLTAVDDFSLYKWIILMKSKAKTRLNVFNFVKMVEVQHKSNIKFIRSDNFIEYIKPNFYASKVI